MATEFNKGIGVVSGFALGAASPLDYREVVATKADLQAHIDGNRVYAGMHVWVEDEKLEYVYNGTEFVKFDQSVAVVTNVTVNGDVNEAQFEVGSEASATVALTLKTILEAGTGCKLTVNEKGLVTAIAQLAPEDIPALTHEKITDLGDAALKNVGVAAGQVVVVGEDGKIADSLIPKLAISNTYQVDNEEAMLGLTAEEGDIAIRSDLPATFILKQAPASTKENWVQLATPTDTVLSVNGKTGTVVLTTSDVAEGTNLYYTEERATQNFNTNIAKTASTALSDGANIYRKGEQTIVPTDVVEDETHRFVTDTEKASYADKYTKAEVDAKEDALEQAIAEVAEDVAAVPVIEKIEFTAEDGRWGELADTTYTLTLSAAGKEPMGAVYRNTEGKYEAVMVDVAKQGDNITVVSMEKFAGYILVYGLPVSA